MRIIHLTDPHLSEPPLRPWWSFAGKRKLGYLSWSRRRRHLHRREILARVDAAVRCERPDLLAITGDLVQLGLADEIDQAAAWLAGFAGTPIALVPGNHDLYQADADAAVHRAWAPYLGLAAPRDDAFPSVRRAGEVTVIGVNSAEPRAFWSAGGRVGRAQRERLAACLRQSAESFRCVLVHHPPWPGACARRKALDDAAALAELLESHAVELVLHGHLHRNGEQRLGARTRVLATASASNAAATARASFRVIDIGRTAAGWRVQATLKTLAGDGEAVAVSASEWDFPYLA